MKYDIISFGDITTDCFIRLQNAEVHCEIDNSKCTISMPFGTKIPFESATEVLSVGNAPNAAVACAKLGLSSGLVAHVGDDQNGKNCLAALAERGVATEHVATHPGMKTNYHYILQYGPERTILIKHEAYPYKLPAFAENPAWFYVTSLPDGTLEYQLEVARHAKQNGIKLAFQPGTYQLKLGAAALKEMYEASEIFFCNKEEAQLILGTEENDLQKLLAGIKALGPKIPVITDGRNGSYILEEDGTAYHIPMYPDPAPPVSRTGAGDTTASTSVAYLIKGLTPKDALMRGVINAAIAIQSIHAQLGVLTAEKIEEWYAKRPAEFVPTKI